MDRGAWWGAVHGLHDWACVHKGGGRWVDSNEVVELKKKKKKKRTSYDLLLFKYVFCHASANRNKSPQYVIYLYFSVDKMTSSCTIKICALYVAKKQTSSPWCAGAAQVSSATSWCLPGDFQWSHFPGGSDGKESTYNVGDLGSIPGLGRPPGEGHDNPLHFSILAWRIPWTGSLAGYSP